MKIIFQLFVTFLAVTSLMISPNVQASTEKGPLLIVPRPQNAVKRTGEFRFSASTSFVVENVAQSQLAEDFARMFTHAAGFTPKVNIGGRGNVILHVDHSIAPEAYKLDVTSNKIVIDASSNSGFFYALQTIRQLLPPPFEQSKTQVQDVTWTIPALHITDSPRFAYRGLMLDVVRSFIPKKNVLRIIDCMAMLKMNKLHLHLVDDNGWRLEIKKYPRLTSVGAWRVDRGDIPFPARRNPLPGEPTTQGGFYTQQDMREIIKYAAERQVEIIPEIEMPAHTNSSLAAYPQLACPVVKKFIGVLPGLGGDHADIIYCAGNDSTFIFLQDVLDEVMALFPSRYIHLGGDEAWKTYWKICPRCQARMKSEHLTDVEDLQGYFMQRMSKYVRSKGHIVMGWDELTNSTLPEGAIIFGWQGNGDAALKAAAQGHQFIMTPARMLYLIRYQGPQWFEPLSYFGNNTLKDVYDYEPIQTKWKKEYIPLLIGVQASMWTEFCSKPADVDYMLFPRLAALAEIAWTRQENKNWSCFLKSLDSYNEHIAQKGIVYARSMYNIQHKVTSSDGKLSVSLECIRPDVVIRYTTDGTTPTAKSALYVKPITVRTTQTINCATFSAKRQMGKVLTLPIHWNKATAKRVISTNTDAQLLTNGLRGSNKYTDFEWCLSEKNDSTSFVIDLNHTEKLNKLTLGCITNYGMAVHNPKTIRIELSDDNKSFATLGELQLTAEQIFREGTFINDYHFDLKGKVARYVRIIAWGAGSCPSNHVRPGQAARMYFDEVIVE